MLTYILAKTMIFSIILIISQVEVNIVSSTFTVYHGDRYLGTEHGLFILIVSTSRSILSDCLWWGSTYQKVWKKSIVLKEVLWFLREPYTNKGIHWFLKENLIILEWYPLMKGNLTVLKWIKWYSKEVLWLKKSIDF